jgi:hypothetical protein
MRRRAAITVIVRFVAIAVVASGLMGPAVRQVTAQDDFAAAVYQGACAALGDVAADLRPLKIAEGGARTSFTIIDVAIDELTSGGHAVVVGDADAPVACGEIAGQGNDVYVAVPSVSDEALSGVAWLHARDDRTQVSLFVGERLSGAGTATDEPTGQPEPPTDETPAAAAATETYVSPGYGYSVAYSTERWKVEEESSSPTDTGPYDYFVLTSRGGPVLVEIAGFSVGRDVAANAYLAKLVEILNGDSHRSETATRTDADGNPIQDGDASHAFVATTYLYTKDDGEQIRRSQYLECWQLPEPGSFLLFAYTTNEEFFDEWMPEAETLIQGIRLPE